MVVLEMGGYRNESDFHQLELPGMLELYLGGGLVSSEDGSISILAGSTLGGGTIVNYMNCIRTPQHIREEWAAMGVEGIDEPRLRGAHRRGLAAARRQRHRDLAEPDAQTADRRLRALGYPHRPLTRNADSAATTRAPAATATRAVRRAASSRR